MITSMAKPAVPGCTFKFSPDNIKTGCADSVEAQAALRRVGQLHLQVDSVIHESEANVEEYLARPVTEGDKYWNPKAPVQLWGNAISVKGECAPAGTKDAHVDYRDSRKDGDVARVSVTTSSDGFIRAEYFHPMTGGSIPNRLGNLFYSVGMDWLGGLCQKFDHGPKNERIVHHEFGHQEEVALLADGSAHYSSSTSDLSIWR